MVLKRIKQLGKLKLLGQGTGLIGVLISLIEAVQTFFETFNFLQFIMDVTVVFLTLDQKIAQNIDSLKEAGGLEFIVIGLGIYGKLWILYLMLNVLSKPIMDTAVSDDMPVVPIIIVKILVFLLIMTPLVFIGQIVGIMIEQGSVTMQDLQPPWIGLYSIVANAPLMLEVITEIIEVIMIWVEFFVDLIPFVDMDSLALETQNTSINNSTTG